MQNSYILILLAAVITAAALFIIIKINILKKEILEVLNNQNSILTSSIDKITQQLIDTAKENQKQISNNSELFNKIQNTQAELKENIQSSLLSFNTKLNDYIQNRFDTLTKSLDARLDNIASKIDTRLESSTEKMANSLEKQKEQSRKDFDAFITKVESSLDKISNKVDVRLKEGFENVDKTFKDIIEGIARISEAQKKIEQLSGEVVSLQQVLSDKKTRGIFGEIQLENILKAAFGEKRELYDLQHEFNVDNKRVVADAVIQAPQIGTIAVDSKFPLENYTKMVESHSQSKKQFASAFKINLKKHIDDIASKYIIKGTTADMAILFLPAEAIFAELNAYHQDIVDYAYKKNVWIASPTTLMALLTTIQAIVRDIKTQKQAKRIQEELIKLSKNFSLYKERWEKFIKEIEKMGSTAKQIKTTTDKISTAFERIEKVEFKEQQSSMLD